MALDPDSFRSVLGRFATGVTVVTARDAGAADHGMTVSAFCSVSLNPPLVLLSIDERAEMHAVLRAGSPVVVNVLAAHQEALSRRFAELDGSTRFDGIGFTRSARGIAVLDDVAAWLEAEIVRQYDEGDHRLFIAAAESAVAREVRPLLHYRGGYAELER